MDIKIISTFENAKLYLDSAENNASSLEDLWDKYMIEPFWADISKWAPFDQSFKKPSIINNIAALKEQLVLLKQLSIEDLYIKFLKITEALPIDDNTPMLVYLFPHCDSDKTLKEKENGVRGTVVFGNIIITINPFVESSFNWLPYVFAHEYNHNVWGYHKFVLQQGKNVDNSFLEYMLTEGQADAFAESLFPHLIPQWNRPFDSETEKVLWEKIKPILYSTDRQIHDKFMFGNASEGLPWCTGYSFGRSFIADYLSKHPNVSFLDLITIPSEELLKEYHLYH